MSGRAFRAILAQWRAAWMAALQYRSNFLADTLVTALWVGWTIVPLWFVFHRAPERLAGWSYDESLLVTGFFMMLQGVLEALIEPNLRGLVEHVRHGTLDFVLLKPVDSQVLVSFGRVVPAKAMLSVGGLVVVLVGIARLPVAPDLGALLVAPVLLMAGLAALYGLWLLVVSTSFWFVRVDNLSYLLTSILDAGRWPMGLYRPALRAILTFVVPVGIMTTWPALALRGLMRPTDVAVSLTIAATMLVTSRLVWRRAVASYTSASS